MATPKEKTIVVAYMITLLVLFALWLSFKTAENNAIEQQKEMQELYSKYNVNVSKGDMLYKCSNGDYYVWRKNSPFNETICGRNIYEGRQAVNLFLQK